MIYGVKGSRDIKQTEAGDLLTTSGIDKGDHEWKGVEFRLSEISGRQTGVDRKAGFERDDQLSKTGRHALRFWIWWRDWRLVCS